jgi:hypothetical protein
MFLIAWLLASRDTALLTHLILNTLCGWLFCSYLVPKYKHVPLQYVSRLSSLGAHCSNWCRGEHTLCLISLSMGVKFLLTYVIFMCFLEIEAEVEAVKRVTKTVCPLKIVLDRVVLMSTGVLLGLWQVWIFRTPCPICQLTSWISMFSHWCKKF